MSSPKPPTLLMIPGPTPLPDAVREALAKPAIGHRSADFKVILKRVFPGLQWAFQAQNDVLMYSASGTGAMEAALSNVLSPGDHLLVLVCGVFSQRFAEIAKTLGINVEELTVPAGQPNTVESLKQRLAQDTEKKIKAVTMIHSETSTGVLNPVKDLIAAVKDHGALSIVDTVTGLGSTEFRFDAWGADIAVSGSQKGFMIPPGLSFLAFSQKAWKAHQDTPAPGYYFNFAKYKKSQADHTTPYTPATPLISALDVALEMMKEEGLENTWRRHQLLRDMTRAGAEALGLELFVKDAQYASCAVTAILPPSGVSVDDIRKELRETFGIVVADGQKELKGQLFRIGHLGHVSEREVYAVLAALEKTLVKLTGSEKYLGKAVQAAQQLNLNVTSGKQPSHV